MALVGEAIGAGARQDRACAAICLSHRTLQRWQRDQSRGDQRPVRLQASKNKLNPLERERLLAVANSAEFGHLPPARSFLVLRIAGDTSLLNRPFTASCAPKTRVSTAVPNGPHKSATSRVRSVPRHPISCSVGTSRISPHRSRGALFTWFCSWISLAERSSAGRSMRPKAVRCHAKGSVHLFTGTTRSIVTALSASSSRPSAMRVRMPPYCLSASKFMSPPKQSIRSVGAAPRETGSPSSSSI